MKIFKILLAGVISLVVAGVAAYYVVEVPAPQKITWGVNFSQMQAEHLGLDWRQTYLALLEDLGAKHIKLVTQWDWVEGKRDDYYFQDIDWQVQQAKTHGAKVIYVVGMKTGRWPECHLPAWAEGLSKEEQQAEVLAYVEKVVRRYKNSGVILHWQAENEPLFKFGQCPWYDKKFLAKEVALIKSLDSSKPVIISDTGEWSLWWQAGQIGDVVGTTLYRRVWVRIIDGVGFYTNVWLPAKAYGLRLRLIRGLLNKPVINVELQAEPWASRPFYDVPLAEQEKSMSLAQFKKNIMYAKKTGLNEFYLWGVEWMYWLKEKHNKPEIWNEAKILFRSNP